MRVDPSMSVNTKVTVPVGSVFLFDALLGVRGRATLGARRRQSGTRRRRSAARDVEIRRPSAAFPRPPFRTEETIGRRVAWVARNHGRRPDAPSGLVFACIAPHGGYAIPEACTPEEAKLVPATQEAML